MVSLIILLLLLVSAIIFAVQNAVAVQVKFFFWELSWPLAFITLLFFAVGVAVGLLAVLPTVLRKHRKLTIEQRRREELEEQRDTTNT